MIKVNKGTASPYADGNINLQSNIAPLHQTRERDFIFWLLIIFALLALTEAILIMSFSLMGRSAVASFGIEIGPLPSVIDYVPADILSAVNYEPAGMQIVDYGSSPDISELLIAAGLGLIALFLLLLARWRVIHNRSLYADRGCPRCNELELVRIDRRITDRALSATGVPVFRYACRNCTWRGRRLGLFDNETHFHKARESALSIPNTDLWQAGESAQALEEEQEMEMGPLSSSSLSMNGEFAEVGIEVVPVNHAEASPQDEPVQVSDIIEEAEPEPTAIADELIEESPDAPVKDSADTNSPEPIGRDPMIYPDFPAGAVGSFLPDPQVVPLDQMFESLNDVTEKSSIDLDPEEFERLVQRSPGAKIDR